MKKFLLLGVAFFLLITFPETGFGKCNVHFNLTRTIGSYSIPVTLTNGIVYFFSGETITASITFWGSCYGCNTLIWYEDGNIVQQGGTTYKVTLPGSYQVSSNCITISFIAAYPLPEPNWLYTIKALDGTYTGHSGVVDNYSASCGIQLTSSAESPSGNSVTGFSVDWYLDSVYQFTKGGNVEFTQPGLIYYRVNPDNSFYCNNPLTLTLTLFASPYELFINVNSEPARATMHDTIVYNVIGDYCLLSTYEKNLCYSKNIATQWLLDNSYYASTSPGQTLFINHAGLITAVDTINNIISKYKILLQGDKLIHTQPPKILNLHYKIIDMFGHILETGDAHDYQILRNEKPAHTIHSGIYFVIYYDALDNRQVLNDKVFVGSQP